MEITGIAIDPNQGISDGGILNPQSPQCLARLAPTLAPASAIIDSRSWAGCCGAMAEVDGADGRISSASPTSRCPRGYRRHHPEETVLYGNRRATR
ncbi:MAG: hypothetical protein GKR94_02590 [Gammaproteobacteria bacterium]|nr:hypothetical protein [Gammaproteobacteria bacterium]